MRGGESGGGREWKVEGTARRHGWGKGRRHEGTEGRDRPCGRCGGVVSPRPEDTGTAVAGRFLLSVGCAVSFKPLWVELYLPRPGCCCSLSAKQQRPSFPFSL